MKKNYNNDQQKWRTEKVFSDFVIYFFLFYKVTSFDYLCANRCFWSECVILLLLFPYWLNSTCDFFFFAIMKKDVVICIFCKRYLLTSENHKTLYWLFCVYLFVLFLRCLLCWSVYASFFTIYRWMSYFYYSSVKSFLIF